MKESKFIKTKREIIKALEEKPKYDFDSLLGGFLSLAVGNLILIDILKNEIK